MTWNPTESEWLKERVLEQVRSAHLLEYTSTRDYTNGLVETTIKIVHDPTEHPHFLGVLEEDIIEIFKLLR
jgi:hypothetical protein